MRTVKPAHGPARESHEDPRDDGLPHGWTMAALEDVCSFASGGTPTKDNPSYWTGPIPWASPKDLKVARLRDTEDHISAAGLEAGSALAPARTVLVVVRGMILARDIPMTLAEVPVAFNQDLKAVIPGEGIDADYLLYAMLARKTDLFMKIGRSAHGTRTLLSHELSRFAIPVAPIEEQKRIAAVLSLAQRAIRNEEKAIAMTRELKRAAMAIMMTRGLHKETQRETDLGSLPTSWEVAPLGSLGRIGNGSTPLKGNTAYWTLGSIPWITSASVYDVTITRADQFVTPLAIKECHLPMVQPGSVLVAITGQGKTLGHSAVTAIETCVNQHIAYIQFNSDAINPHFIRLFLETKYDELRAVAHGGGSTKGALTCGFLRTFLVPVPPRNEQDEIASDLMTIEATLRAIERRQATLRELHDCLLSSLMTGEIRVDKLDIDTAALAAA